jgi:hypothetical protein
MGGIYFHIKFSPNWYLFKKKYIIDEIIRDKERVVIKYKIFNHEKIG